METAIQITVAGVLLLAWIWVLGRPLVASQDRSSLGGGQQGQRSEVLPSADLSPDGSDLIDFDPSFGRRVLESWKAWLRRPAEVWRRQLLLASILAAIVSSLLAIALRTSFEGRFVQLFGLMMLWLAIHVVVATIVGRRMLTARRAAAVAARKSDVAPAGALSIGAMSIGAEQAGDPGSVGAAPAPEEPGAVDEVELADDEPASAFDLAAELASELGAVDGATTLDGVALVSGLIESEWGTEPENEEPEVSEPVPSGAEEAPADVVHEEPTPPSPGSGDELVLDDDESGSAATGAEAGHDPDAEDESESEAIFRRAAKDEPARGRRGAKPIYIESQLDDGDDVPKAKAVNHP